MRNLTVLELEAMSRRHAPMMKSNYHNDTVKIATRIYETERKVAQICARRPNQQLDKDFACQLYHR